MAKKKATLLEDVMRTARNTKPGPASWVDVLPPDIQDDLAKTKAAYRSQSLAVQKYGLARAIKAALENRGHRCANAAGVVRWLDG